LSEEQEQYQESQALIPIEQQTILFRSLPLVVVRLPDGRPGVVLRWICENLHLASGPQVLRIKRTEAIANDLVYVRVQTDGGPQIMPTLVLRAAPYWLATIDTRNMKKDDERRLEILAYQREVVDVLYAWASTPKAMASSTDLVPAEPITQPARPAPDATIEEWIYYHQQMLTVLEWQRDIEHWRGSVESRLEGLEAITDLIPEILERLGPETLTVEHQHSVQGLVKRLHDATGKPYGTIYDDLKKAFAAPRYQEIRELEWDKVLNWFQVQIDRTRR
jgi:P22_AR N-terminal domain